MSVCLISFSSGHFCAAHQDWLTACCFLQSTLDFVIYQCIFAGGSLTGRYPMPRPTRTRFFSSEATIGAFPVRWIANIRAHNHYIKDHTVFQVITEWWIGGSILHTNHTCRNCSWLRVTVRLMDYFWVWVLWDVAAICLALRFHIKERLWWHMLFSYINSTQEHLMFLFKCIIPETK